MKKKIINSSKTSKVKEAPRLLLDLDKRIDYSWFSDNGVKGSKSRVNQVNEFLNKDYWVIVEIPVISKQINVEKHIRIVEVSDYSTERQYVLTYLYGAYNSHKVARLAVEKFKKELQEFQNKIRFY